MLRVQTHPLAAVRRRRRRRGRGRRRPVHACSPRLIDTAPGNSQQPGVPTMNRPVSPRADAPRRGALDQEGRRSPVPVGKARPRTGRASAARSCSCTARRWPRSRPSTCRCRAAPDCSVMDWFAARGFDTWCVDMEGYGRSDKKRDINFDIANGADDLAAASDYILTRRATRGRCWSTASRRARCAPRCSPSAIRSG